MEFKGNATDLQEVIDKLTKEGMGETKMVVEMRRELAERDRTESNLAKFITVDPDLLVMKDKVRKLSLVDDPVLIIGETGTGKELIANALHGQRKGPFTAINCAGMPSELIESELFGHVKGAFTDAKRDKVGLMESAKDGTLFLDEIGEMEPSFQAKMLRAINEKKIRRVGAESDITINCRIVSATHRNLFELINQERFREDLYWRVSTFILMTKPLRIRLPDVPLILKSLGASEEIIVRLEVPSRLAQALIGNVRSLQQVVRRNQVLGELP